MWSGSAFTAARLPSAGAAATVAGASGAQRFLAGVESTPTRTSLSMGSALAVAGLGVAVLLGAVARGAQQQSSTRGPTIVACNARPSDAEAVVKQAAAGAAAAAVAASSIAAPAEAYPIFAQQNYASPIEPTGKIACANCHLQGKYIEVKTPHEVLPDTIFKIVMDIPAKYEKRMQPIADGSKAPMNVGAIAIMPQSFKLAPKDRLPKALKKQMKGLAWAPYSKEKPNIVVAGPVPGKTYGSMVLPVLAPDPNKQKGVLFDKYSFEFGGNRGRGQVYPEGNLSNNNVFNAAATGTVTAIEAEKIVITQADGTAVDSPIGKGATVVVEIGESVKKDEQITTNPNVGGFGQDEREIMLQDMNRVYAYCALSTSIFLAQLAFVLKKKQFEKVQLAEGF